MRHIGLCTIGVLMAMAGPCWADTTFTLQADSFRTQEQAEQLLTQLKKNEALNPRIHFDGDAPGQYRFKVLVGEFPSEGEALKFQKSLEKQGVKARIAALHDYKKEEITAAIKGQLPPYFQPLDVPAVPESETTPTLESPYKELLQKVEAGETTAPVTLKAFENLLQALPDDHPMKGGLVLSYANARFKGHSAYEKNPPDHVEVRELLKRVANREIAATETQRRTARDKVVLILHYYNQDYIAAIRGYHQMINENAAAGNDAGTAAARTSLAGCITEMARDAGYSRTLAMDAIYDLWNKNTQVQDQYSSSTDKDARAIRNATYRSGIMVTINLIERKMWKEAKVVADSMISAYTGIVDCRDMLAESLCHKVNICTRLGQFKEAFEAGEKAEAIARESKLKWGEENHAPLWKALTWQLGAAVHAKDDARRAQIEDRLRKDFPEKAEDYIRQWKR